MTLLALEFSTDVRSAAVVRNGRVVSRTDEAGGRSTRAFALIEEVLRAAELQREDVEVIAVGLGPGSYTGIRVAISLAQGWQLARGVRLIGVDAAEALATEAAENGVKGTIHVAIDAQRNELYHAVYANLDGQLVRRQPLRLAGLEEVRCAAADGTMVCGPDLQEPFPGARRVGPQASTLARLALLAAERGEFVPGNQLQPVYLREVSFVKAPPARVIESE